MNRNQPAIPEAPPAERNLYCPNRREGDEDGVYATCKAKRCSEYTQKLGWLPEIPFVVAGTGGKGKKGSFLKRLLDLDFSCDQSFYCLENPPQPQQLGLY